MSLILPPKFEQDIQTRDTSLIPIVIIHANPKIYISPSQITYDNINYKPLLLNIPTIKESIDLETRNYKISNITLSISNVQYDNVRFSDSFTYSVLNTVVTIYWVSPSGSLLSDAMLIYEGVVRKYDMDDEKAKLSVEDRSQSKLHKDLPTTLSASDTVPEKYRNRIVPICYGVVEKSPLVINSSPYYEEGTIEGGEISIIPDKDVRVSFVGIDPLFVEKESNFINIPNTIANTYFSESGSTFTDLQQYIVNDDVENTQILLQSSGAEGDTEGIGSAGLIENDQIVGVERVVPSFPKPKFNKLSSGTGFWDYYVWELGLLDSDNKTIKGTLVRESYYCWTYGGDCLNDWNGESKLEESYGGEDTAQIDDHPDEQLEETIVSCTMSNPIVSSSSYIEHVGYIYSRFSASVYFLERWGYTDNVKIRTRFGGNTDHDTNWNVTSGNQSGAGTPEEPNPLNASNVIDEPIHNSWSGLDLPIRVDNNVQTLLYYMRYDDDEWMDAAACVAQTTFQDIRVEHWVRMDGMLGLDFYGDVIGRLGSISSAPSIINDIMQTELNQTATHDPEDYLDWRYDFAVSKRINSKKLIEELASASPFIPRFNYLGEFMFTAIPPTGGTSSHTILESECIDFSFSQTDVSDVVTKVQIKYDWDYSREEFRHESSVFRIEEAINYDYGYYGFPESPDGGYDLIPNLYDPDADSTLIIDDERGKYIRNHDTANFFANWMLWWHCNQHLKIKIKLPLKYMHMEVGDIVDFDDLLGGIRPYNKSYINDTPDSINADSINRQVAYTNFIITSANKTMEWCQYELIQLHVISATTVSTPGCMDSNACNYSPQANNDDGSCIQPSGCNNDCQHLSVDCSGVCGGVDSVDICGVCGGGVTELGDCEVCPEGFVLDCNNVCGGDAVIDECGVCGGNNTACLDCAGVVNGNAVVDCAGECGGSSVVDECGVCGGSSVVDECGVCFGSGLTICSDGSEQCECDEFQPLTSELCPYPDFPNTMTSSEKYDYRYNYISFLRQTPMFAKDINWLMTDDWEDWCAQPHVNGDGETLENCCESQASGCFPAILYGTSCIGEPLTNASSKVKINIDKVGFRFKYLTAYFPAEGGSDTMASEEFSGLSYIELKEDEVNSFDYEAVQGFDFDSMVSYIMIEFGDVENLLQNSEYGSLGEGADNVYIHIGLERKEADGTYKIMYRNFINIIDEADINTALDRGLTDWSFLDTENLSGTLPDQEKNLLDDIDWDVPSLYATQSINYRLYVGVVNVGEFDEEDFDAEHPMCNLHLNDLDYYWNSDSLEQCGNITDGKIFNIKIGLDEDLTLYGDLNNDGTWDVLDVVQLVNCVLEQNCPDHEYGERADVNRDGNYNVLDIVKLANCVLSQDCMCCLNKFGIQNCFSEQGSGTCS